MMVYGDRERPLAPQAALRALHRAIVALADAAPGVPHLDAATAVLIDAAAVAQPLLDEEHRARGGDGDGPLARAAHDLVRAAADLVGGRSSQHARERALGAAAALSRRDLPREVRARDPEGFVHYALDPLVYARIGRELARAEPTPIVVVGLRTIGLALGAMVASAAGPEVGAELVSVRPVGHPFRRELCVKDDLAIRVLAAVACGARVAVVDEGPGLSGSSFGAALAWLRERGVPMDRVHVVPGHAGLPGPEADPEVRDAYARLPRHVVPFERMEGHLARWLGASGPIEPLDAGRWRDRAEIGRDVPVDPWRERRKYLVPRDGAIRVARFAGYGAHGERRIARARVLAERGLSPEPIALRRGFLVMPWIEGRAADVAGADRAAVLDVLARLLGTIASELPAAEGTGAPLEALVAMAEHNAARAIGEAPAGRIGALRDAIPRLAARERRVAVDARLHAWEWIVGSDGRAWKTDALDHHDGHDLVGCQDLAWDLAGAEIELALAPGELAALLERVREASGWTAEPELLALHRVAYAAFHAGRSSLAADALRGAEPAEAARHDRERGRYAGHLARAVARVASRASVRTC